MHNTTDMTKLFVRFLREKGIKYIFVEETLRDTLINDAINNNTDGDLLKYFDKFFSRGLYNVISISLSWINSKKGSDFWPKIEAEWELYYIHK